MTKQATKKPVVPKMLRYKGNVQFIDDKSKRHVAFSKRKAGLMKKGQELSILTGSDVLVLVASKAGHIHSFATPQMHNLVTSAEGKAAIQAALHKAKLEPSKVPAQPIMSKERIGIPVASLSSPEATPVPTPLSSPVVEENEDIHFQDDGGSCSDGDHDDMDVIDTVAKAREHVKTVKDAAAQLRSATRMTAKGQILSGLAQASQKRGPTPTPNPTTVQAVPATVSALPQSAPGQWYESQREKRLKPQSVQLALARTSALAGTSTGGSVSSGVVAPVAQIECTDADSGSISVDTCGHTPLTDASSTFYDDALGAYDGSFMTAAAAAASQDDDNCIAVPPTMMYTESMMQDECAASGDFDAADISALVDTPFAADQEWASGLFQPWLNNLQC
eukprot:GFYU01003568.1.p1 GENE.GFYU01003568.1~~GFYU01003568.1.p1  ORF type:complete len:391 (+),score=120.08 GFYU01003568.1:527-1699(+)